MSRPTRPGGCPDPPAGSGYPAGRAIPACPDIRRIGTSGGSGVLTRRMSRPAGSRPTRIRRRSRFPRCYDRRMSRPAGCPDPPDPPDFLTRQPDRDIRWVGLSGRVETSGGSGHPAGGTSGGLGHPAGAAGRDVRRVGGRPAGRPYVSKFGMSGRGLCARKSGQYPGIACREAKPAPARRCRLSSPNRDNSRDPALPLVPETPSTPRTEPSNKVSTNREHCIRKSEDRRRGACLPPGQDTLGPRRRPENRGKPRSSLSVHAHI
eukprot:gene8122-biopygen12113